LAFPANPLDSRDIVRNKPLLMTITIPLTPQPLGDRSVLQVAPVPKLRLQRRDPEAQKSARDDGIECRKCRFDRVKDAAHRYPHR
jgi:hypothetical protein